MNPKSAKMTVVGVVVLLVVSVFLFSKKEEDQSPASLQNQEAKTQIADTQESASSDNQMGISDNGKASTPDNTANTPGIAKTDDGETANWKTYLSSKYGFTIKYPEKWYVLPDSDDFIGWSNYPRTDYSLGDAPDDFVVVSMAIDKTSKPDESLKDFFNGLGEPKESIVNEVESKIQNRDMIKYSISGGGAPDTSFIMIRINDDSVMDIQTPEENSKMLDLMVSTLEFAK